jgi:hypothetical protein
MPRGKKNLRVLLTGTGSLGTVKGITGREGWRIIGAKPGRYDRFIFVISRYGSY